MPKKDLAAKNADAKLAAIRETLTSVGETLIVPSNLLKVLKSLLNTKDLIPKVLNADDKASVRRAQASLQQLQEAQDKAVSIHFSIRRRLELLLQIELEAKHILLSERVMPDSASGPRQQNCLLAQFPQLALHHARWNELDKLCTLVQVHLGRAMRTIELQMKLDDNVRWAQYRS